GHEGAGVVPACGDRGDRRSMDAEGDWHWDGVVHVRSIVPKLSVLGTAGESLGMDRMMKANAVKHRTHSLFRQGLHYYRSIPMMPELRLRPLIERFAELVRSQQSASRFFESYEGMAQGITNWRRLDRKE